MSELICLTLSMFRSFICKTRSSTGLRVISASENRLKSANTAEEYSLQIHTGSLSEYKGTKHVIILSRFTVLTCSSAQALFGQLYLPSDWLRPEKSMWPWRRKLQSLCRNNVSSLSRSRPHTWFQGSSETSQRRLWQQHTDESQAEEAWTPVDRETRR